MGWGEKEGEKKRNKKKERSEEKGKSGLEREGKGEWKGFLPHWHLFFPLQAWSVLSFSMR